MGGRLVFTWDSSSYRDQVEFDLLKDECEALKNELAVVKVELAKAEKEADTFKILANEFKSVLTARVNAPSNEPPIDAAMQNKSCA